MAERFPVDIEAVPSVMALLPGELKGPGSGIIYDDGELVVNDEATATELRRALGRFEQDMPAKRHATNTRRRTLMDGVVRVNGHDYPTDDQTMLRLSVALQSIESGTVDWRALDGFVELDVDGLRAVLIAINDYTQKCFSVEAALQRSKITIDEVDKAAWPK
jgi:hypothetical protein